MIRFDRLPEQITQGELNAIASATADGWIIPPLYNCLRPSPPRSWRTVHLRYLQRRGLVGETQYRADGMWMVRLNAEGSKIVPRTGSFIFATAARDFIPEEHAGRRFMVLS